MRYTFKFTLFGNKVKMFRERHMGVVIEKEPDVVCVYGTDENYHILCAVPLCPPKKQKGEEYVVEFDEQDRAMISVRECRIMTDFAKKKCANNLSIQCYGSEDWGHDVQVAWNEI